MNKDRLVSEAHRVQKVISARAAPQARTAPSAHVVTRDPMAIKVKLAIKDPEVTRAPLDRLDPKVKRVHRARMARGDPWEPAATRVPLATRGP